MKLEHKFSHKRVSGTRHAITFVVSVPDTALVACGGPRELHREIERMLQEVAAENRFENVRDLLIEGQMNFAAKCTDVVLRGYADRVSKAK